MALVKDWWSMGLDVFEWNVNFFLFIGSKQELWMCHFDCGKWRSKKAYGILFQSVSGVSATKHGALLLFCRWWFAAWCEVGRWSWSLRRRAWSLACWWENAGVRAWQGRPGRAASLMFASLFLPQRRVYAVVSHFLILSTLKYRVYTHTHIYIYNMYSHFTMTCRSSTEHVRGFTTASQQEKPHDWWDYNAAWLRWRWAICRAWRMGEVLPDIGDIMGII